MANRGPRPKTLADFPGLVEQYRAGKTVEQLEVLYRATRRTLVRLLRAAGESIVHGASPARLSAGQRAAKTHHRRKRFVPDSVTVETVHQLADACHCEPEAIIARAVATYTRRLRMSQPVAIVLPAGVNPLDLGDAELAALVRNLFLERLNAELLAAVVDVEPEEFPTPVLSDAEQVGLYAEYLHATKRKET